MNTEFYAVLALGLILLFAYRLVALIRKTPKSGGAVELSVDSRDVLAAIGEPSKRAAWA